MTDDWYQTPLRDLAGVIALAYEAGEAGHRPPAAGPAERRRHDPDEPEHPGKGPAPAGRPRHAAGRGPAAIDVQGAGRRAGHAVAGLTPRWAVNGRLASTPIRQRRTRPLWRTVTVRGTPIAPPSAETDGLTIEKPTTPIPAARWTRPTSRRAHRMIVRISGGLAAGPHRAAGGRRRPAGRLRDRDAALRPDDDRQGGAFKFLGELTTPSAQESRDDRYVAALHVAGNRPSRWPMWSARSPPATSTCPASEARDMYHADVFARSARRPDGDRAGELALALPSQARYCPPGSCLVAPWPVWRAECLACSRLVAVGRRLPGPVHARPAFLAGGAGPPRRLAAGPAGGGGPLAYPGRPGAHRSHVPEAGGRPGGRPLLSPSRRRPDQRGPGRVSAALHGRIPPAPRRSPCRPRACWNAAQRTFGGQAIEMALRALQLQARWFSKRQMLALYLTLAPYGGNLEGVRAACPPISATSRTASPTGRTGPADRPAPVARSPPARPPPARGGARRGKAKLLHRWSAPADRRQSDAAEAEAEPLPRRVAVPALAWHAAGELARAAPRGRGDGDHDPTPACSAAGGARREAAGRKGRRRRRRSWWSRPRAAPCARPWVRRGATAGRLDDMTRALRSPGSALKPFIYAFAFDEAWRRRTPPDRRPARFADYQPEDFDRSSTGQVTAREALTTRSTCRRWRRWRRSDPRPSRPGWSRPAQLVRPRAGEKRPACAGARRRGDLARDLAALYAGLADEGLAKPLAWTGRTPKATRARPACGLVAPDGRRDARHPARDAAAEGTHPGALTRSGPRSPSRPAPPTAFATPWRWAWPAAMWWWSGPAGPTAAREAG